ncbi:hypothetical protein [Psychromonas aquatilis]|uniref:Cell division inhibitor SulA n=1 Tax=Psychromonas aquatilis TaxID=2005072 RepID=A0ABU9GT52_9GAMM
MLSRSIEATRTNPYLLNDYDQTVKENGTLVHVHYQENNYHSLLSHIQNQQDQGWILFLAPPGKPNTAFLKNAGIDKSRILMIDSSKVGDHLSLLSTLLTSDNYCTVVTWVDELTTTTRLLIEANASQTNTSCFIYCKQ